MMASPILLATLPVAIILTYVMFGRQNVLESLGSSNRKPGLMFDEYDFIIIGGGSAGAVVANRLSEIPEWNVLLLEAGGDEPLIADVPALAVPLQNSDIDWQYKTVPQERACLGSKDQRCYWPRGKVIGGSSVLNYMVYLRGNRRDFDGWEALGNEGWGYDHVLPYFKKSEDNRNQKLTKTPYHSSGGYLTVEEASYHTPLSSLYIQAGKELGYDEVDLNGDGDIGFMITQGTLRRGSRCSTAKAFLRPARRRSNLHISMDSRVTRIIINPETKAANGVEFSNDGQTYRVFARKEVILSAGSISSPHILMLSGIGPKEHLELKGIHAIHDLPGVGQNLQDHLTTFGADFLTNESLSINAAEMVSTASFFDYVLQGKGPLTSNLVEAIAFIKTKYANYSENYPDLEIHFMGISVNENSSDTYTKLYGLKEEIYNELIRPIQGIYGWSAIPTLLHPKSRGFIRLNSDNPFDPPKIQPNYFSDPRDIKVIVEGLKFSIQLSETEIFQNFDAHINNATISVCNEMKIGTDEYWECLTQHLTHTMHHQVGTCKMGPNRDPSAVVDPQLRVHGMMSLRVIDASIMPNIVGADTNAATIMIAEKGSDMIKEFWKDKRIKYNYY